MLDWKHWALSHAVWIAVVGVALVMGHSLLAEHDARLLADAQIKVSEAQVKDLQAQIVQTNAAAAAKVQVITKIVHDIQTAPQAVAAVPQLTNVPLNARVAPDNPAQVAVDAIPFVNLLAQAKTDSINLAACTDNLKSETAIVAEKQTEIVALKKKPSFFKRVTGTLKSVGIGVGIGIALGAHL